MKFLVVDDHELIREAMSGALAELDGEAAILEAADSREAMRLIEEHPDVDLILLDLNLRDRVGFTVLSELRKSHPAISVVVMSAQQDHDSVVKAREVWATRDDGDFPTGCADPLRLKPLTTFCDPGRRGKWSFSY